MVTKTEVDKNNNPVAVYHRAGTIAGRKDERYIWTHEPNVRPVCCTDGLIPPEIRSAK